MAKKYIGIDIGKHKKDIVVSAADTGKAVQIVVDLAVTGNSKLITNNLIEVIQGYLKQQKYPIP